MDSHIIPTSLWHISRHYNGFLQQFTPMNSCLWNWTWFISCWFFLRKVISCKQVGRLSQVRFLIMSAMREGNWGTLGSLVHRFIIETLRSEQNHGWYFRDYIFKWNFSKENYFILIKSKRKRKKENMRVGHTQVGEQMRQESKWEET